MREPVKKVRADREGVNGQLNYIPTCPLLSVAKQLRRTCLFMLRAKVSKAATCTLIFVLLKKRGYNKQVNCK
jgi:hypothetical protein